MAYLYLSEKDLPEIADWKVGNTYKMTVEVTLKQLRQEEFYNLESEQETIHGEFGIESINGAKAVKEVKDMDSKEYNRAVNKMLS